MNSSVQKKLKSFRVKKTNLKNCNKIYYLTRTTNFGLLTSPIFLTQCMLLTK